VLKGVCKGERGLAYFFYLCEVSMHANDFVGDGDCGLTMARGAKEILSRLDNKTLDTSHPALMFQSITDAVSASMGGTSGVLLELMFRKIGSVLLASSSVIDEMALWNAFHAGVDAVSLYGGATVGSRTMLDALCPAVLAAEEENGSIEKVAEAAEKGAKGTASMLSASAGRSNYLREEYLAGTPDPGAVAVGVVLKAISKA